jgi:hypothetical protein
MSTIPKSGGVDSVQYNESPTTRAVT